MYLGTPVDCTLHASSWRGHWTTADRQRVILLWSSFILFALNKQKHDKSRHWVSVTRLLPLTHTWPADYLMHTIQSQLTCRSKTNPLNHSQSRTSHYANLQMLGGPSFIMIKCGQLILRKISTTGATRCQILRPKCTKFDFRWGSASDPAGGFHNALPRPIDVCI